jgi:molybdate transport system substrate-binding protein
VAGKIQLAAQALCGLAIGPWGAVTLATIRRPSNNTQNTMAANAPATKPLEVIMSGGFAPAYQQLLPAFEAGTGITVHTASGASQGTGPQTIAAALARGEPADVVILSREGLAELQAAGHILAGSDVDLALVPLGAGVRTGAPGPVLDSVSALKQVLLAAHTVAVPGSTSGIYLREEVFPKLGLQGQIEVVVKERGSQSAAAVAQGLANIALQPLSELVGVPGIDLVGRLPAEVQLLQIFAGAITTRATRTDAAQQLLAYLASDAAVQAKMANGMDAVPRT